MADVKKQPLKVFLCHASGDKPAVRDLYKRLTFEGIDAWLDQEKLLPGQDWRREIPKAVREADVVVICFSKKSITKEGYVQKEIKFALDIAEEKPDGTIFLIPARLEDCVIPDGLSRWQWVDLFDDNGYAKLLRSLKLRADAVGATVEPASYVDSDKETERRLEQLYTEGLAAFYTEDWDKACQRFQMILSERPTHRNAAKKLAEAEQQRDLANLYKQAAEAIKSEDWRTAVQSLEELALKSSDYKDVTQLLKNARKQRRLSELYLEAKTLHAAQKWKAVVKVFEQISVVDPNYPDADGLLQSAQVEVVELERLAALNDQYSRAIHEIDAGNWQAARKLLEMIHKSETGFRETEKLLKKVEDEVVREEEARKQRDLINTLYEQAHGLLRSKKWRNALDKLEEIRKLDDQFPDTDGIREKAQKELAQEEQEAERQNQLAALYADAVRLLKEGKYQEALDKWREVKEIDPKYPDRQRVQKTARKKLAKAGKSAGMFSIFQNRVVLGGTVMVLLLILAVSYPTISQKLFPPITSYEWHFDNDSGGWINSNRNNMTLPSIIEGNLTFYITGEDPFFFSASDLQIPADDTSVITIRMRVEEGAVGGIFFVPENGQMSGTSKVDFPLKPGDSFHTYDVDMTVNPLWKGVINQIRLDPVQQGADWSQKVEIDFISIHAP